MNQPLARLPRQDRILDRELAFQNRLAFVTAVFERNRIVRDVSHIEHP